LASNSSLFSTYFSSFIWSNSFSKKKKGVCPICWVVCLFLFPQRSLFSWSLLYQWFPLFCCRFVLFFILAVLGLWTWASLARQVFYHLSHVPNPLCFSYFSGRAGLGLDSPIYASCIDGIIGFWTEIVSH
jgi:hypothetical protein